MAKSIPPSAPAKDQPFYHFFAETQSEYRLRVQQNLLPDTSDKPLRHPQVKKYSCRTMQASLSRATANSLTKQKNEPKHTLFVFHLSNPGLFLLRGCRRWCRCSRLLRLQLLARLFRFLLQLFLQFALCSSTTFGSVGGPS